MSDRDLATRMQPWLHLSGPMPSVEHIEAAIKIVRDGLTTRVACGAVVGATQHSKAGKFAHRIRQRLSDDRFAAEFASQLTPSSTQPSLESICVQQWQHEQPPRLQEDFGGELGRNSYELARTQWYFDHKSGDDLPPFCPTASPEEQRQQISARTPLWEKAVRAYKEKQRDRSSDHSRLHRRNQQQCWVDEVRQIVAGEASPPLDLLWPACEWRADGDRLQRLYELLSACPPTGEVSWCQVVEQHAATLYLGAGDYWDDTVAASWRMVTTLGSTPSELRHLPLNDHLWVRHVNEQIGFTQYIRSRAACGDIHGAIERLYQLSYSQYLSQRDHPCGIVDASVYVAQVGFCPYTPIGHSGDAISASLCSTSDVVISPAHPHYCQLSSCSRVRDLIHPNTLLAESAHMISPYMRGRVVERLKRSDEEQLFKMPSARVLMAGIIPYGDYYRLCSVVDSVAAFMRAATADVLIDLNDVMRMGVLNPHPIITPCTTADRWMSMRLSAIAATKSQEPAPSHERSATIDPLAGFTDGGWTKVNNTIRAMVDNGEFQLGSDTSESECGEDQSQPTSLQLQALLDIGQPLNRFVGLRVQLRGLQSRPELNFRHAVILHPRRRSERVAVKLDGDVPAILLKPCNIFVPRPDEDRDLDSDSDECTVDSNE